MEAKFTKEEVDGIKGLISDLDEVEVKETDKFCITASNGDNGDFWISGCYGAILKMLVSVYLKDKDAHEILTALCMLIIYHKQFEEDWQWTNNSRKTFTMH